MVHSAQEGSIPTEKAARPPLAGYYQRIVDTIAASGNPVRGALDQLLAAFQSHVDGRDLLDEIHPRKSLDVVRRLDGRETVFEGDWLTNVRTAAADAFFVWRRFIDDSGQEGVNCAIFRNEGPHLSSLLIRQADAIADRVWAGVRHYTYVDPAAVRSANPGACFRHAGWRRCGFTKSGLLILERL